MQESVIGRLQKVNASGARVIVYKFLFNFPLIIYMVN